MVRVPVQIMNKNYICYHRVSTKTQGVSGLGLDSQKSSTDNYIKQHGGLIVGSYVEVESGKNNERPELLKCIEHSKKTNSTILVSKLDRLTRSLHFLTTLQESGVKFQSVDLPSLNDSTGSLLVNILGSISQFERELISKRTKDSLQQLKKRGVKLGGSSPSTIKKMNEGRRSSSLKFKNRIRPIIEDIQKTGVDTLQGVCDCLTLRGIKTMNGKKFYPTTIRNYIQ